MTGIADGLKYPLEFIRKEGTQTRRSNVVTSQTRREQYSHKRAGARRHKRTGGSAVTNAQGFSTVTNTQGTIQS